MRVLLVESRPGLADRAEAELRGHGYAIVRCHDAGAGPFPCAGVVEACPLLTGPTDVAVVVRGAEPDPSRYEDGVSCAIRHNVPLVVAAGGEHPYRPWAAGEADPDRPGHVAAVCDEVLRGPLPLHGERATSVARQAAVAAGRDAGEVWVEVHRSAPDLRAVLHVGADVDIRTAEWVATRVRAALHDYDRDAGHIDVTVLAS